ncbi:MAG: hypothetical protein Q3976_08505 [Corynebacterium sp.]|nr:hypothetical protein [Corynebacterium sp.]
MSACTLGSGNEEIAPASQESSEAGIPATPSDAELIDTMSETTPIDAESVAPILTGELSDAVNNEVLQADVQSLVVPHGAISIAGLGRQINLISQFLPGPQLKFQSLSQPYGKIQGCVGM